MRSSHCGMAPRSVTGMHSLPEPLATVLDYYLWFLHLDRRMSLDVDLGPLHVHLYSRAVFLMWVTVAVLAIAGIAVLVSRKPELVQKWRTWMLIAPVVGTPDLDRPRHHRGAGRSAGRGRGDRVRAVGEPQQGRHLCTDGAGGVVSARGVAASGHC